MAGTALVSQHLEALALASELRCGFSGTNRGTFLRETYPSGPPWESWASPSPDLLSWDFRTVPERRCHPHWQSEAKRSRKGSGEAQMSVNTSRPLCFSMAPPCGDELNNISRELVRNNPSQTGLVGQVAHPPGVGA